MITRRGTTSTAGLSPAPARIPGLVLALALTLTALAGCGDDPIVDPVPLQDPFVKITGGPLDGSEDSYTARIFWAGWDEDGIIERFEYAVDPPLVFTREEIADPEIFPDIDITLIPGPALNRDTLVVSKIENGERHAFRWVQTVEFSRSFAFSTPKAESLNVGGRRNPTNFFTGAHRVYVRSFDNDGRYSDVDQIGYTARTITPTATIARPNVAAEILNLGGTVTVSWDGLDPDSPDAARQPTGYLYRLLRLDALDPPISIIFADPQMLYTQGDRVWTYQDADTLETTLRLNVGGQYIFGVRAVDVAGAVEPFIDPGRNFFKFQAFALGGFPALTVCEPGLGCFEFLGVGAPVEVQVPTGAPLRFQWEASGELYGGEIESYSWGLDVPDLDREGPDSGWNPWGDITISPPIVFERPGIHVLYIRARDISGAVTVGSIILDVLEFTFEREVLFVDDVFDRQFPTDSQHDAFWRQRFQEYGVDHIEFNPFGEGDGDASPVAPTLADLGKYRLIIWENNGGGYNAESALIHATGITPILGSYLNAGGKLWLGGRMTVPACLPSPNGVAAELIYPIDNSRLVPGTFAYDFLKLRTTLVQNPKSKGVSNFLYGVAPFPGKTAYYDSMTIDQSKVRFPFQKAVTHCDILKDPIFAEQDPAFRGDIDSLYIYRAYGPEVEGNSSSFHRRLNAIRWHDPDPDRFQGRIQWFGFALYFMRDGDARETFTRSMDWFREEVP